MSNSEMSSRVQRSVITTAILVVLFAVQALGFGLALLGRAESVMEPENLVQIAEEAVKKNYPDVRDEVVAKLEQEAPTIAREVSDQLIATAPQLRQELEKVSQRQLELGYKEATEMSVDTFQSFVQANKETVGEALSTIHDAPEKSKQLIAGLEKSLEEAIGAELEKQSKEALQLHRSLNEKLERLIDGSTLEPKELIEKRMVRIVKTLAQEKLPDTVAEL